MRAKRNSLFGERRGTHQPARLRLPLTRVISPPIRPNGDSGRDKSTNPLPAGSPTQLRQARAEDRCG